MSDKLRAALGAGLQSEGGLSPEKLGELLVAVESYGGTKPLVGDSLHRILRGGLVVRGYLPSSGGASKDVNVITAIHLPFLMRHLDTPELEQIRKKWVARFGKVKDEFYALTEEMQTKQWMKSPPVRNLMDPIMKPVITMICGKDNTLANSGLPDGIKKLLISIDKSVIAWFKTKGSGNLKDLLEARKSAMIGFLSTRSLGYAWMFITKEKKELDDQHLSKLLAYLNSYVSTQMDAFITDILLSQPDQPKEVRKYIEMLTGRSNLKFRPSVPNLKLAGSSALTGPRLLSPRPASASTTHSADDNGPAGAKKAEKEAKTALMKMRLERAQLVDELARAAEIDKTDYQCYLDVKARVIGLEKRGFANFKNNPLKYLLAYVDEHYGKPENREKAKQGLPDQVKAKLYAGSLKTMGNPFEDADEPVSATTSSRTPSVRREPSEESSATESGDDTES